MDLQNHAKGAAEQSQHSTSETSTTRVKELLIPINQYRNSLVQEIDAAEWIGDFTRADNLKLELWATERLIAHGETYYCLH